MNSLQKRQLKSILTTSSISAVLSAVFMFFMYYAGWQSIAAGLCLGFFIPLSISFYSEKIARRRLVRINLLVLLGVNTIVNILVIFGFVILFIGIFYLNGKFSLMFENWNFFYSNHFLIGIGFGLALTLSFNFLSILNTLIGRNILVKLFIGIYRNPKEVNQAFMFLDIKSSTSIAERIGHQKFLSLINDFFYDIAEPVRQTKGEIYKYVGDEAIITWKMNDAVKDENCIRCFFLIKEAVNKNSDHYINKYGIVPEFKAGLHGGIAITGELGYTKREIAYMGDVLNTTARIEESCKKYNEPLLISGYIISLLIKKNKYSYFKVGTEKLRGKEKEISIYKISS